MIVRQFLEPTGGPGTTPSDGDSASSAHNDRYAGSRPVPMFIAELPCQQWVASEDAGLNSWSPCARFGPLDHPA